MIQQIEQIQSSEPTLDSDADIESLFSEQSELNDDTVFALPYSDPDSNPDAPSDPNYSDSTKTSIFQLQPIQSRTHVLSVQDVRSPHVQTQILLDKYDKPINVIVYIDTRAYKSMLDSKVLPPQY
ncbi:hypothetical protein ACOSQ2_031284 [Xanthoceras sorbifolium]